MRLPRGRAANSPSSMSRPAGKRAEGGAAAAISALLAA
jgi:hypothetical protein